MSFFKDLPVVNLPSGLFNFSNSEQTVIGPRNVYNATSQGYNSYGQATTPIASQQSYR